MLNVGLKFPIFQGFSKKVVPICSYGVVIFLGAKGLCREPLCHFLRLAEPFLAPNSGKNYNAQNVDDTQKTIRTPVIQTQIIVFCVSSTVYAL